MSTKTMSLMLAIVLISTSFASAVEWADKMFSVKKHDFGSVAVASKTEYRFEFKNIYKEDVHIASVRTSCGCTTPIIEKHSLKTGETGTILARFNTGSFKGKKGATLTVVIDRPYYAEVQLRVDGYIRRDIVFSPGDVQFGQVDAGGEAKKRIQVSYAGRDTWQILDIESADPGVSASFAETSRSGGRVGYDINLTLSGVAKPGVTRSHIVVITNDRAMPRVPVEVMYDVKSPIMVSPQIVSVGNLKPGEVTEQRLIVRSDKPFRLIDIEAEGFDIEYNRDAAAKKMHVLPLKITAGAKAGRMQQRLTVHTDLPGELTGSAMVAGVILGQ